MTLFLPDLNCWLALSHQQNPHAQAAWRWFHELRVDSRLVFRRYTQSGSLRLLSNQTVMGEHTMTFDQAWDVYGDWLNDPQVEFRGEPGGLDSTFFQTTAPMGKQKASKWLGDAYPLAYAKSLGATLVTFDHWILEFARKHHYRAMMPA